ncbi:hypothetical protein WSK_4188 [Novosphingobium sp. Rr 2-17]|nr:hypothetical protein WSK_4188 [Novosphingobium sp. Rr 2-17]
MLHLFDYVFERSLAGHAPKEVEIAQEVFGKDAKFGMGADASVPVYVHRLRRKHSSSVTGRYRYSKSSS